MISHGRRSIRCALALAGLFALVIWASRATAQIAPWQRPPTASSAGAEAQYDGLSSPTMTDSATVSPAPGPQSSSPWTGEENERWETVWGLHPGQLLDGVYDAACERIWFRSEFLAWWTKGIAVPALLTTSPPGTDPNVAGIVGEPGTSVLLGNEDLHSGFRPGMRLVFGTWLGRTQTWGLEASYLQISSQTDTYQASSGSEPILARPFFNSQSGQEDAELISYPGQQSGSFTSIAASELQSAEFLLRKSLFRGENAAFDFTLGYRYMHLNDHLEFDDSSSFLAGQSAFPAGSVVAQTDHFDTLNDFEGGQIGFSALFQRQRWTLDASLKVGVGQTSSKVTIDGSTTSIIPGQATSTQSGGVLALPSNSGVFNSQRLSVVSELGLTLGWDFTPQLRGTIGYDLLYWTGVARPGDQIDQNINTGQFPPPTTSGATRPEFVLHTSDYWAQGVNLGLDLRF
jgi:hypothetical protein